MELPEIVNISSLLTLDLYSQMFAIFCQMAKEALFQLETDVLGSEVFEYTYELYLWASE